MLDKIADESDFAIDVKPRVELDTKILDEENMADSLDKHKILEKLSPAQVINTIPSDIASTHDTIQNIITSSQSMRTDSISKKKYHHKQRKVILSFIPRIYKHSYKECYNLSLCLITPYHTSI